MHLSTPWVNLCDLHDLLNDTLQLCQANNKYVFILGDFNVDLSLNIKTSTSNEDFNNLFSMHHFVPLINKPTGEMKNSKTVIDNIVCNVPLLFDMCDVGILRPYISDHHAIFCILKIDKSHNNPQTFSVRKNILGFNQCLLSETWDLVYTQKGFTLFQGLVDLFFGKCFQKQIYTITYKNLYPWMTNELRANILKKN